MSHAAGSPRDGSKHTKNAKRFSCLTRCMPDVRNSSNRNLVPAPPARKGEQVQDRQTHTKHQHCRAPRKCEQLLHHGDAFSVMPCEPITRCRGNMVPRHHWPQNNRSTQRHARPRNKQTRAASGRPQHREISRRHPLFIIRAGSRHLHPRGAGQQTKCHLQAPRPAEARHRHSKQPRRAHPH